MSVPVESLQPEPSSPPVLVVHDSEVDRFVLRRHLRAMGHTTVEVPTAAACLELLRTVEPLLVILDVNLPDLDGFALAERIRSDDRTAEIPIVHVSGARKEEHARVAGLRSGGDAYLVQPVSAELLEATVEAVIRARSLNRRLELALSIALVGTWEWEPASDAVHWSPGIEACHGMEPGTFPGTLPAFLESVHPHDRREVHHALLAARMEARTVDLQYRYLRVDGTVGVMRARGRASLEPSGMIVAGVAVDVTDTTSQARATAGTVALGAELRAASTAEEVEAAIVTQGLTAVGGDAVVLVIADDAGRAAVVRSAGLVDGEATGTEEAIRAGTSPLGASLRTGRGQTFETAAAVLSRFPRAEPFFRAGRFRSWATLPLRVEGRVIGAIGLAWSDRTRFDPVVTDALDQLTTAAAQAHRATTLAAEQQRISERLQRALLPQLPADTDIVAAAGYATQQRHTLVGGDLYDLSRREDGRWLALMGDVAGHGIDAAARTSEVRHIARAIGWSSPVDEVLRQADRLLSGQGRTLCTLTALSLHSGTGEIALASAGHPPPLLRPRSGPARYLDVDPAPPLGAGLVGPVTVRGFHLSRGDRLVLYTDGLVERRGEDLALGLERLRTTAGGLRLPVGEWPRRLLELSDGRDDAAVLVLALPEG
jgi:DNA-binding response OmpR family regulator